MTIDNLSGCLALSLSPTAQNLWRRVTDNRVRKELYNLGVKCARNLFKQTNRWVLHAALDTANIGPVNSSVDRQIFLR
jgi:hypothetical protein